MKINRVTVNKIYASGGSETPEVILELENNLKSFASVPAGISAGKYEAIKTAPENYSRQITDINQLLIGKDWTQETLDKELKAHTFGGNITLAVSAAFWRFSFRMPQASVRFPQLFLLAFEGGKHGNSNLTIQEFCLLEDSLTQARSDYLKLRQYLSDVTAEITVGAEGGFSPLSLDNIKALETIGINFPQKKIALDVADTFAGDQSLDYPQLISHYPLFSLEDPYNDEDWEKWSKLTADVGNNVLIIGDDLTSTNPERIKKAIELRALNAVVIKPNQIGTITDSLAAVKTAREGNLKIVVSHRGEETNDTWIVDFALAIGADYVKLGGFARGERIAKYNRLKELGMN